ncbi:type II toxin-antitoxin system HipA family toxin [Adlercreutzia shanghongiae]|uniref:Type II toxin-antitoxin system HipA family toxin n=1 Tax=Adlercreutzia shanghongiae TaxID=3111773 RepID=A0ABU6IXZ0_9ACTN|nr:type II toxin-antitoxin system HipA family toxin [Adlercreutzia sp. R22]MEC4294545.1 type II toxin-antitoxin system HipA family toxin [Adlercreutzia sp. R22]
MTTVAEVRLWGTAIGAVAWEGGSRAARFQYNPSFVASGIELAPLVMPLSGQVYSFPQLAVESFHGLPGLLADSLPDKFGNAVIDSWLEAQGRPRGSLNPVERLCYTGVRGMGALEYVPAIGPEASLGDELEVEALVDLASRILTQRETLEVSAADHAMEQIIRVGTSAGGARAKAVVSWNEQTGEMRSGQTSAGRGFGHWLIKFDGVSGNRDKEALDGPRYTVIEYAYYLMARMSGISMEECRLFEEGGRRHFMTRRFDRTADGDKIHMQSLGALAHFDFNVPGAHSYEQAVEVARRVGLGQEEAEEIFRRMVFNVMARNQDDHVKNVSFLMGRDGAWHLAPAYDVTYAYNPDGIWTGSHQMTVNGKRDGIERGDCLAAAEAMSIKASRAREILGEVADAVSRWGAFADEAGLPEAQARSIQGQFVSL